MPTATPNQIISSLYVAAFNRAPDKAGFTFWQEQYALNPDNAALALSTGFVSTPSFLQLYPVSLPNLDFVQKIYINVLGRPGDAAGVLFWTQALSNPLYTRAQFLADFVKTALEVDLKAMLDAGKLTLSEYNEAVIRQDFLTNKADVGIQFANTLGADSNLKTTTDINDIASLEADPAYQASQKILSGVTNDDATALNAISLINSADATSNPIGFINDADIPGPSFTLTDGIDNLTGNSLDNAFNAPVVQNNLGALSNTFETGDTLNGGAGTDTLNADLTAVGSISQPYGPAISATTSSVEIINFRVQAGNDDTGGQSHQGSEIDAENMSGVQQFWDTNSRSNLQIEDIRTSPEQLTFGMQSTDPGQTGAPVGCVDPKEQSTDHYKGWNYNQNGGADYRVYFSPDQVGASTTPIDSKLTLTLVDADAVSHPATPLANVPVSAVVFKLEGVQYVVGGTTALAAPANTYEQFATNLQADLKKIPALADIVVTLNPDHTITLTDPKGGTFTPVGYQWVDNIVPPAGTLHWDQQVGAPIITDVLHSTNVLLDDVGRTSQGGKLDIGSMAAGGIEIFNIDVDRSSWLTQISSNSNFGGGPGNLETVNLTSIGAKGNLTVGDSTGYLDGRVVDGLIDVRTVNTDAFDGTLNLGIVLTEDSITRYLNDATGPVQFSYTGGNGNDNFNISVNEALSADPDFAMTVNMGAGDDRLNISVPTAKNVTVDGGTGNNTIAVSDSHGTTSDNTFKNFSHFQTYEVEGNNDTEHNFTSMAGVTKAVIATWAYSDGSGDYGADTTLINLEKDATVTIDGKNQTQGDCSNDDQYFGNIDIQGSKSVTLDVTLQNAARVDGVMWVDSLNIGDNTDYQPTRESAVRTLDLHSAGNRSTSNVVKSLTAERVTTLNLDGTQALALNVETLATLPSTTTLSGTTTPALTIDGSHLGTTEKPADLTLAVNAGNLDNTNHDVITGTAGENDVLALYQATGDINSTISGFETIQFGWNTGSDLGALFGDNIDGGPSGTDAVDGIFSPITFDAANTTGVDTFQIALRGLGNGITLDNLSDGIHVILGDKTSSASVTMNSADNTLIASSGGELNLALADNILNGATTHIEGFRTVNLDVASTVDRPWSSFRDFSLDLDTAAKNLIVTGGDSDNGFGGVTLDNLAASLVRIDFKDYNGDVEASLANAQGGYTNNTNTTIIANQNNNFEFDESNAGNNGVGGDNMVNTYVFGADVANTSADWTIDGFVAFNDAVQNAGTLRNDVGSLSNLSILDLSDLDVNGLSDIVITYNGTDTDITSNEGLNFEIILTGVNSADLSNENFIFA